MDPLPKRGTELIGGKLPKREIRVDWPTFVAIKELSDRSVSTGELNRYLRSVGLETFDLMMGRMGPQVMIVVKSPYFEWREKVLVRAAYCRTKMGMSSKQE